MAAMTTVHVGCPRCGATNRVDLGRARDGANCGSCHRPLFDGHPVALDPTNFAPVVERTGLPVIVDFWAPWCGPCQAMAPHFERAAQVLEPEFRLAKLDTEAQPGLARTWNIRSIPTLILFSGGKEIARRSGAIDRDTLVQWARQALGAGRS
jgi:thioredoxin 2